ncbi:hypothetical protein POVCU1_040690, partial [Plasmodium ovale curtisi]
MLGIPLPLGVFSGILSSSAEARPKMRARQLGPLDRLFGFSTPKSCYSERRHYPTPHPLLIINSDRYAN